LDSESHYLKIPIDRRSKLSQNNIRNPKKGGFPMALDAKLAREKLCSLLRNPDVPELPLSGRKYVLFSDLHLGDGGKADDFSRNEPAMMAALSYYKFNGFYVILLGDTGEIWQFDYEKVRDRYNKSVYAGFRAFGDGHVFRIAGNHDSEWSSPRDPIKNNPLESQSAPQAIRLVDASSRVPILLIHGHQGDEESDKHSWSSRFWVRVYKAIEPIFKIDRASSATKSQITRDYEKILYSIARENKFILICGHSHRAIFASLSYIDRLKESMGQLQARRLAFKNDEEKSRQIQSELQKVFDTIREEESKNRDITPVAEAGKVLPCYFNTGCGVFSDGITAIEIADDKIRLVKWEREPVPAVPEIFQEGILSQYLAAVDGA